MHLGRGVDGKCGFFVPFSGKSVDFLYPDFSQKIAFLAFFLNIFFKVQNRRILGEIFKKLRNQKTQNFGIFEGIVHVR